MSAVVCGAWHAPVLDAEAIAGKRSRLQDQGRQRTIERPAQGQDDRDLDSLDLLAADVSQRLRGRRQSPGWYAHLWESNDEAPTRWLATAARLLRAKDLDASSAERHRSAPPGRRAGGHARDSLAGPCRAERGDSHRLLSRRDRAAAS